MLAEIIISAFMVISTTPAEAPDTSAAIAWNGPILTAEMGVNLNGPNGAETWYCLPMSDFFAFVYDLGFEGTPFVDERGVWNWQNADGTFVVVGADLGKYPRGTYVETSLGPGIVLDTGYFYYGENQFDIATTWGF